MFNCNAFTNHLCITVSNNVQPCCRFEGFEHKFNYQQLNYKNYLNVNAYGWVEGCDKCKQEEEKGITSYRILNNNSFGKSNKIEFLELSLSNKCNLTCKMCSPEASDKWGDLVKDNIELQKFFTLPDKDISISIPKLFSTIDFTNLASIKYLGGEPFITPEFQTLCKYLDEKGIIDNVKLWVNTNITTFPNKTINYIKKFKKVHIALSLDGIGKLNDYIRFGKSWNVIEENLSKWISIKNDNILPYLHTTVQAYNVHALNDISSFAKKNNLHSHLVELKSPKHLSINALSPSYVNSILNESNKKYFSNYSFDESSNKILQDFTTVMDSSCNININEVVSNWSENYDR